MRGYSKAKVSEEHSAGLEKYRYRGGALEAHQPGLEAYITESSILAATKAIPIEIPFPILVAEQNLRRHCGGGMQ